MKWVVITEGGNTSWSEETDAAESFPSVEAAVERATQLGRASPGETFGIYQLVVGVKVPIGDPVVTPVA